MKRHKRVIENHGDTFINNEDEFIEEHAYSDSCIYSRFGPAAEGTWDKLFEQLWLIKTNILEERE
jgi:hypothetical protein